MDTSLKNSESENVRLSPGFISKTENNTDVIENDSDNEEVEIDPNMVEERFRVDRRKLEQMIQIHGMLCSLLIYNILRRLKAIDYFQN